MQMRTRLKVGGQIGPNTNLAQTVSFAKGLIGHVLKLIRDSTGAPARRVVLDHRRVELRHVLSWKETEDAFHGKYQLQNESKISQQN